MYNPMSREYSEIGNRRELATQNQNWADKILPDTIVVSTKIPPDAVNHPSHYTQGGVECIDALTAATTGLNGIEAVCTANAIKYLWRWKLKNGVEDLKKAQFYINYLINKLEKADAKNESDSNG